MKKNMFLAATLMAVGILNAAFFVNEYNNSSELRIESLEMLAEGETFGMDLRDEKDFYCYNESGDKKIMHECSTVLGDGCENEICPQGYTRQKEQKASGN